LFTRDEEIPFPIASALKSLTHLSKLGSPNAGAAKQKNEQCEQQQNSHKSILIHFKVAFSHSFKHINNTPHHTTKKPSG
jgi:hypothetical protein